MFNNCPIFQEQSVNKLKLIKNVLFVTVKPRLPQFMVHPYLPDLPQLFDLQLLPNLFFILTCVVAN